MTNVLLEGYYAGPSYVLTARDFKRYSPVLEFNFKTKLSRHITVSDLRWCDALVICRGNNPLSAYLARKAKEMGRKVILGLDDDLIEYNSGQHYYIDNLCKKNLRDCIKVADIMSTTSKYLGDKYKNNYGINYSLLDTVVNLDEIDKIKDSDGIVKIVYAAAAGHVVFFNSFIKPVISKLSQKYKGNITFTFIGVKPKIEEIPSPVAYIPSMPFAEYQAYMKAHAFDIGLAPLFENELCKSKYFNKYLEYSKHRICGIYSDVMPYNLVIKNEVNGILSGNTPEDWYCSICKLIDDTKLRTSCVSNALDQIKNEFNLQNICRKLKDQIPFINSFKAPDTRAFIRPMYLYFLFCELRRRLLNFFMR